MRVTSCTQRTNPTATGARRKTTAILHFSIWSWWQSVGLERTSSTLCYLVELCFMCLSPRESDYHGGDLQWSVGTLPQIGCNELVVLHVCESEHMHFLLWCVPFLHTSHSTDRPIQCNNTNQATSTRRRWGMWGVHDQCTLTEYKSMVFHNAGHATQSHTTTTILRTT